eukprot:gene13384-biopygen8646
MAMEKKAEGGITPVIILDAKDEMLPQHRHMNLILTNEIFRRLPNAKVITTARVSLLKGCFEEEFLPMKKDRKRRKMCHFQLASFEVLFEKYSSNFVRKKFRDSILIHWADGDEYADTRAGRMVFDEVRSKAQFFEERGDDANIVDPVDRQEMWDRQAVRRKQKLQDVFCGPFILLLVQVHTPAGRQRARKWLPPQIAEKMLGWADDPNCHL